MAETVYETPCDGKESVPDSTLGFEGQSRDRLVAMRFIGILLL